MYHLLKLLFLGIGAGSDAAQRQGLLTMNIRSVALLGRAAGHSHRLRNYGCVKFLKLYDIQSVKLAKGTSVNRNNFTTTNSVHRSQFSIVANKIL